MSPIAERDRARAHSVLDALMDMLASHAPSSGWMRVGFDPEGRLRLETKDFVAELGQDPLTARDRERKV